MFSELAVLEADDIGGDPGGGTAVERTDQVKQALAPWCDVGAVLDVAVGPKPFGGRVSNASSTIALFLSVCESLIWFLP
jgi:hypothetical protein